MLIAICQNGTVEERGRALRTLVLSERLRERRMVLSLLPGATPVGKKRRAVFDARHRTTLPGTLVRSEGDPPGKDAAVDEAYDGAGATYDLYQKAYKRNSIDGRGLRLDSSVHYAVGYDNAFWNGSQIVCGDGDGKLFNRFTISVDVLGHELTHGVTEHEANLDCRTSPAP
jgi:Zn-dependent metalloprotease